ncbi:GNAT family N-acetyltransferase [Priestia koreensis]|uniref:GNAT family acetyltransferase n=1 Tax=Priestia koreensis TaxID=284581 RepID=A0A0M0LI25_9BACI|nr:GNAT family N-acetyltransferase [Priestia koreensis]KOO50358.1 GNAT family acetyltransferase [Priestia koreensis]MCM3004931.1 GNAT family N-acetyltransferase [Priestia koreensis]UNL85720.1 GNAT family N-acetyltransferase [Priestia koreensis]
MMITYRPANTQDYHEVNKLLSDTQRLHAEMLPMNFEKNATVLSPTQYQSMLFYSTNDILVAVYNQEIVGVSVVELMYTPAVNQYPPRYTAYIQYFGVHRDHRHRGIGKQLFHVSKEWAKQKGASDLQLTVWSVNNNAVKFYEGVGMHELNKLMTIPLHE